MRLLTCERDSGGAVVSLTLHEYFGDDIPPYVILSHRWGKDGDEVSFTDLTSGSPAAARAKKGFAKLANCCVQALQDGYEYVWADTCCIDKSSSAELTEGINSMYAWYRDARVCYAYLEDVPSGGDEDPAAAGSAFRRCVWFTRGWTLQELIAPASVFFYARDWDRIGSKASLADVVGEITNIDRKALVRTTGFMVSIAMRMSWAANRKTARVEDRAYSLLGIFGVNMPVIYGEGPRAFQRLQHEILKVSTDHSIFAWQESAQSSGMLASSPDQFADSAAFHSMRYQDYVHFFGIKEHRPEYAMTNFGLRIQLPLIEYRDESRDGLGNARNAQLGKLPSSLGESGWRRRTFIAFLACSHGLKLDVSWIFLTQLQGQIGGHYTRVSAGNIATAHGQLEKIQTAPVREVVITEEDDPSVFETLEASIRFSSHQYCFLIDASGCRGFEAIECTPLARWAAWNSRLHLEATNTHGILTFQCRSSAGSQLFAAVLGVLNWRVWSDLVPLGQQDPISKTYDAFDIVKGGAQSSRCWLGLDWVCLPLGRDKGASVVMAITRAERAFANRVTYKVRIVTKERPS